MMSILRDWLVGITCSAMVVALAESLSPKGAVRKVGRLTGGLVLLLAILHPLMKLDLNDLSGILAQYRAEAAGYSDGLERENQRLMKGIIAEQTSAYILDKAESMGIENCKVTVEVADRAGKGPIPEAVTVMGPLTDSQRLALTRQIEADLAIGAEKQTYQDREDVK